MVNTTCRPTSCAEAKTMECWNLNSVSSVSAGPCISRDEVTSSLCKWCTCLLFQEVGWYPSELYWNGKKIIIMVKEEERLRSYGRRQRWGDIVENMTHYETVCLCLVTCKSFESPNENNNRHFSGTKSLNFSEGWYCTLNQTLRMPVARRPSFVLIHLVSYLVNLDKAFKWQIAETVKSFFSTLCKIELFFALLFLFTEEPRLICTFPRL